MFLKESSDHQDLDEIVENDSDAGRFSNSKDELMDDDQWARRAANSLTTLMKVLACEGVALNIFSLLELLANGSRNGVTAERRKMHVDLVEFKLRFDFDIAALNGTSVVNSTEYWLESKTN